MDQKEVRKNQKAFTMLKNFVTRYERFEQQCTEFVMQAQYEEIEMLGKKRDFLNAARHEDVFGCLPIIGELSSRLMSTKSNGSAIEQYGMSLKLNGRVQKTGENSFDYQISKLKELEEKGGEENYFSSLKDMQNKFWYSTCNVVILKYFLLYLDDENYDPITELNGDSDYISSYKESFSWQAAHKWYTKLAETFYRSF